jgi:peptidyl-prolyl cis-trans isomerase A (cyclophilin A)
MNQTAPDTFQVKFETTGGDFVIEARREWAPVGVDRFFNLVHEGFYDGVRFFRVIEGFMAQFGISGAPQIAASWMGTRIADDPAKASNTRGRVSFAMAGPGSRTTQLFINYGDNSRLDTMGFSPIGEVVEGMDVVDSLHAGYGEGGPRGRGPDQGRIHREGNAYLESEFPELDWIRLAVIAEPIQ